MDWRLTLEFLVIVGALAMGARMGGVGLGLWGAVGLLVLVVGFDVAPANIPGEVLLIVLTVIMAASAMESIGRNPNSAGQIFVPMIIGLAFIEALTLYALVIAFFLQAKI